MSRTRHFFRGLSASWLATLITVFYSLASVPIALHYLSVEEFGLFMLMLQLAGYFSLVELGMAGATARILIDHKDKKSVGSYGSVILTGGIVFIIQGILIMLLGYFLSPLLVSMLSVPGHLQPVAVHLLRWLIAAFATGTSLRIFTSIIYANRRVDLVNLLMSLVPILGLLIMWLVLSFDGGLWWLPWAFVPPALIVGICAGLTSWRLKFLPPPGSWTAPSWVRFKEMFALGRDMFLVNAGNQVLEASQIIIVTRTMGLGAAAVWSVSTKLFTLVYQLVTKIEGTAIVFFSEMMVRGEADNLAMRYRQIYQLTAGVTVAALSVAIAVNREFVSLWAAPNLAWPVTYSLLLALSVYINAMTRCQVDLAIHSKRIAGLRYIYLAEAAAFVLLAFCGGKMFGFPGVIGASIFCSIIFRGIYTTRQTARYFSISSRTVGWSWIRNSAFSAILLGLVSVALAVGMPHLAPHPIIALILTSALAATAAALVLFLIALPQEVINEISFTMANFRKATTKRAL